MNNNYDEGWVDGNGNPTEEPEYVGEQRTIIRVD